MRHKTSADAPKGCTRVYSYGCVPGRIAPVINEPMALDQIRLANKLWNTAVAIERARMTRYKLIMQSDDQQAVNALKEQIDERAVHIKAEHARARSQKASDGTRLLKAEIAELRAERNLILGRLAESKDSRHAAQRELLDANNSKSFMRLVKARQAAARMGLYYGSYNDILQRADTGRKKGEIGFKGYRGEGTLTAQVMKSSKLENIFQVLPAECERKWRYARIRIGSTGPGNRTPVWVELPIILHRPLPDDADIKSVSATRRIVAGKVRWQVNVTLSGPAIAIKAGNRCLALDLNYRLLPEGIRVGYWFDGLKSGEVRVSEGDRQQYKKTDDLQSICDQRLEEIKPFLTAWIDGVPGLNEDWRSRSAHMSQWRSGFRMVGFIRWWADNRLENDEEVFSRAFVWRKQYLHLADWSRNLQDQLVLRRREQYRVFAANMARCYNVLILEKLDLAALRSCAGKIKTEAGRSNQIAAPGELRMCLKNAFLREGGRVIEVNAAYTTKQCHFCNYLEEWDSAGHITHKCGACGSIWDQDYNAAVNIYHASDKAAILALPPEQCLLSGLVAETRVCTSFSPSTMYEQCPLSGLVVETRATFRGEQCPLSGLVAETSP